MATGRHGGYRENEFRGRQSTVNASSQDLSFPKEENEGIRSDSHDVGKGRDREARDRERVRVRQKEVVHGSYRSSSKEENEGIRSDSHNVGKGRVREARDREKDIKDREVVNGSGSYRFSSSRSNSGTSVGSDGAANNGSRPPRFSVSTVDREPGELSSESGSEEATDSDSLVKDPEVSKRTENGSQSPAVEKKRKFSPIVWDRDDNGTVLSSKRITSPTVASLPPPPPLPKHKASHGGFIEISSVKNDKVSASAPAPAPPGDYKRKISSTAASLSPPPALPEYQASMSSYGGLKELSSVKSDKGLLTQTSLVVNASAAAPLGDYDGSESPLELPSKFGSHLDDKRWVRGEQAKQLEEEDYVQTRNILSSRWAAGNISPVDEGEIVEYVEVPKRVKKTPVSDSFGIRPRDKSATPDLMELTKDDHRGARGKSSESDERSARARSYSGNQYSGHDSDNNELMNVEEEQDRNEMNAHLTDTDSESDVRSHGTPEPACPPQRNVNMLQGCRSVNEFERLNKIDEGTYGVVYRARDKKTGEIVALKKVKMEKEREGFPLTSLREINILLSFHHPYIVDVKEVVVGSNLDSIFMVMEYMEHDLKGLMETMKQPFSQSEVKCLMLQLLEGVKYLHDNWVLHRDLKTSNLLLNNRGELKICDFGLARQYGIPLKPYTHLVVTLWYRAPELLLGLKQYSTAIDMWSLGCIMAELLSKEPLFNGKTEFDQLEKIFRTLGTPNETIWPGFSKLPGFRVNFVKHQYNLLRKKFPPTSFTGSPVLSDAGFDLLNKLLTYDPEKRITADAALSHEWFREVPLPKSKDFMPTFPAQHAQDRRMRRIIKSPDPLEEQRKKELRGDLGGGGLFG